MMNYIYIYYIYYYYLFIIIPHNTPIINNEVIRKQKMQHALKMKSDE